MTDDIKAVPDQEWEDQHVFVKSPAFHDFNQQDLAIATEAVTKLGQWYPGHLWRVVVNSDRLGGVVLIYHADISHIGPIPTPYVVHMKTVYGDPDYLWAMRAGGELLERANLRRGAYREGDEIKRVEGVEEKWQPVKGLLI